MACQSKKLLSNLCCVFHYYFSYFITIFSYFNTVVLMSLLFFLFHYYFSYFLTIFLISLLFFLFPYYFSYYYFFLLDFMFDQS